MLNQMSPKWVKEYHEGNLKEVPFSELTRKSGFTDENGDPLEFSESEKVSDGGKFAKDLFNSLTLEFITLDLGRKEKEAILLRYDETSPRKRMAKEIKAKEGTLKLRLYRAKKKIKKKTRGWIEIGKNPNYKKLLKKKIKSDPAYKKYKKFCNKF